MGDLGGGEGAGGRVGAPLLLYPLVLQEHPGGDDARALAESDLLGVGGGGQEVAQLEAPV